MLRTEGNTDRFLEPVWRIELDVEARKSVDDIWNNSELLLVGSVKENQRDVSIPQNRQNSPWRDWRHFSFCSSLYVEFRDARDWSIAIIQVYEEHYKYILHENYGNNFEKHFLYNWSYLLNVVCLGRLKFKTAPQCTFNDRPGGNQATSPNQTVTYELPSHVHWYIQYSL